MYSQELIIAKLILKSLRMAVYLPICHFFYSKIFPHSYTVAIRHAYYEICINYLGRNAAKTIEQ